MRKSGFATERARFELPALPGFQRIEAMTNHPSHSAAFKRQVAEEFIAPENLAR